MPFQISAGPVTQVGTASSYCNMAIRIPKVTLKTADGKIVPVYCHFCHHQPAPADTTFDIQKHIIMKKQDFTVTVSVDKTPAETFDAINNVRGWWSGEIAGNTTRLGDEFTYRYKDLHYSKHKLVELVPEKKVVWLITESGINIVEDKNEWLGTKIIFDIAKKEGKTQIRFTHEGLIPEKECYGGCSNAWTGYIVDSLRNFIENGGSAEKGFTVTFQVDKTPQQAYAAINNVRGWWSENIDGPTDQLNAEFHYHYEDIHNCTIKVVELVTGKRVVWHVLDNYFRFTKDKSEWKDTHIIFDIAEKDGKTQIRFTHEGLVKEYECYEVCEEAWTHFAASSLRSLIVDGMGNPTRKDGHEFNTHQVEKHNL